MRVCMFLLMFACVRIVNRIRMPSLSEQKDAGTFKRVESPMKPLSVEAKEVFLDRFTIDLREERRLRTHLADELEVMRRESPNANNHLEVLYERFFAQRAELVERRIAHYGSDRQHPNRVTIPLVKDTTQRIDTLTILLNMLHAVATVVEPRPIKWNNLPPPMREACALMPDTFEYYLGRWDFESINSAMDRCVEDMVRMTKHE